MATTASQSVSRNAKQGCHIKQIDKGAAQERRVMSRKSVPQKSSKSALQK